MTKSKSIVILVFVLAAVLFDRLGNRTTFDHSSASVAEQGYGPWSIGIYEGVTLFDLEDPPGLNNPVLTARDVEDVDAVFVADPFIVRDQETFRMFFEVMNRKTGQGDIAFASSTDGVAWQYEKVILDEPFHLSYPHVFEWNTHFYMIPESWEAQSVRLYRAVRFPDSWAFVGELISGSRLVDPTIFRYQDMWWMFVYHEDENALHLYMSKKLSMGWVPHPMSPVMTDDKHHARSAGRVVQTGGKLYRITQDDEPSYGSQIFAFEITELSEFAYEEKLASDVPLIAKTGAGWNAAGMHQLDALRVDGNWIVAVDGKQ